MVTSTTLAALSRVNQNAIASKALFEKLAGDVLPDWDDFAPTVQSKTFDADGTVFMQGAVHPFVYVVRRGLTKNVYLREDGNAWIKSFSHEGLFFASVAALKPGGRTSFSAVCIENSELERIPFDVVERFASRHLAWSNALRRAITVYAERKEQRERELLVLSAEQRYRAFLAEFPDLERRVSQKDLAAFVGVTPVGLNRIVKRVNK